MSSASFFKFYQRLEFSSVIIVKMMLEIGFLHIPVSAVDRDDLNNLMALCIIYVMACGQMSISIGNHCVGEKVLGELGCNMSFLPDIKLVNRGTIFFTKNNGMSLKNAPSCFFIDPSSVPKL